MRLTIDTKEDTHEDIRKVLTILTSILERKGESYQQGESVDTASMMEMFDQPQEKADRAPDFNTFLNLGKKEETKRAAEPKIEFL